MHTHMRPKQPIKLCIYPTRNRHYKDRGISITMLNLDQEARRAYNVNGMSHKYVHTSMLSPFSCHFKMYLSVCDTYAESIKSVHSPLKQHRNWGN